MAEIVGVRGGRPQGSLCSPELALLKAVMAIFCIKCSTMRPFNPLRYQRNCPGKVSCDVKAQPRLFIDKDEVWIKITVREKRPSPVPT